MKNITAAMRTHLDGSTTSLTTCWKITRTDGQAFFLTESSDDIVFGGDTYSSLDTYDRTAIANSTDLEADNLEVFALLNSGLFSQRDLENGKFDWAEVELFAVNHEDPDTYGAIRLRTGRFGEIKPMTNGVGFTTQLFGLAEYLNANIEEFITPLCSADLGDSRCKVTIAPDEIARSTAYEVGDAVNVRIKTLALIGGDEAIVNGDYKADAIGSYFINTPAPTGWTNVYNNGAKYIDPRDDNNGYDDALPSHIDRYLRSTLYGWRHAQEYTITDGFATTTEIDNGDVWCYFSVWVRYQSSNRTMSVRCVFLDATDTEIGSAVDIDLTLSADNPFNPTPGVYNDTWFPIRALVTGIPAGARKVRVEHGVSTIGSLTGSSGCFANFVCTLHTFSDAASSELDFAGRYGLVTTAGTTAGVQPTYTDVADSVVADGTASITIKQAFRTTAVVVESIDESNFVIAVTDDDRGQTENNWYDGGIVDWLQGENAGRAIEIKSYEKMVNSTDAYLIETWLPNARKPVVGDIMYIQPGCDKRRETCRDRFQSILNFRGYPDLPGQDEIDQFHAQT